MNRLFVAVDLSPDAIATAEETIASVQRASPGLDVRWVRSGNMHLTVRFIGAVADDALDACVAAVSAPLPLGSFDLTLGECGAFPRGGAPRVIWIGIDRGAGELGAMHAELDARLVRLGYAGEDRPFSAHLTLARVPREVRVPRQLRQILAGMAVAPSASRIETATLYRSHLSPRGARYEPLARIALVGQDIKP